jgi:Bacterial regulatory proteins, tetR family
MNHSVLYDGRGCGEDAEILNYVVLYCAVGHGASENFSQEAVLEKAMPIFRKHGFADTTLQDLEKAKGVNKSGLYTEFRDKEDL